jgi:Rieske Fe-S protein
VVGVAAAIGGTLAALAARFLNGAIPPGTPAPVAVGSEGSFAGGSPIETTLAYSRPDGYRTEMRRERIFLLQSPQGLVALSSTCTHLGCSVRWDAASGLFRCPCHGGVYRPDGSVVAGPPPRALARLPIEIRAGQVFVHPSEMS